ncbi:PREDICTED: uncharacterized protein LOC109163584 [Ipomoea nil]|uniref:uncharacterized protein LOC109163584 n=1 Tax=Ipomoea nil TaxID=35883 RepID=UPI000901CD28|nr:PREDICTED: uncharacterized protein LOC109163584 [Ipomoea nil]
MDEGCRGVVEREWAGSQGLNLQARLDLCGKGLKAWGGDRHHKFGKRIGELRKEMDKVRDSRDPVSLAQFVQFDNSINLALSQEEAFWRQRAKQHWLQGADRNTKFFHKFASHRRKKSVIVKLKDDNGVWKEGQALDSLVTTYYKQIFASGGFPGTFSVDSMQERVTEAQNAHLLRPFEPEEVRAALFSMGKDKSPGPDGMNPGFYQAFWDVIGKDVTSFVLNCLSQPSFPVMVKMVANRMKPLLEGIISESQSAFLPGRLISDNILIASEVGHYLRRKQLGQVGWAALKLDMIKAYDRIEWSFVRDMLMGLGFDAKWVQLIMMCVQTVRYRVLDSQAKGLIHGCRVARGARPISHLFFADDSLLFFKANLQETMEVKKYLSVYEFFSGQAVNFHKSNVSFSRNTHEGTRELVSGALAVAQAEDFRKYLGLPFVVGRNRRAVFAYVEQKLRQRFGSLNKRLLSKAGKEVLLKSVAQAMPTYTMSIFLLPTSLCISLERLMNRYWWGRSGDDGSIHWLAWDRMCKSKKFGGMGFKRLHEFNLALLGKQGWRLLTNPNSLMARVFKARYFPTTSFYEAIIGGNPSYVWRSIMASQDLLKSGCRRRIGNGRSTQVWTIPWLSDAQNPYVESEQVNNGQAMLVSDLIDAHTGSWNGNYLHQLFNPRDAMLISHLPVSLDYDDMWHWEGDLRGCYSVKDGYRRLGFVNSQPSPVWNNVWKLQVPPKWKVFLWRALLNKFPSLDNLINRRVDLVNIFPSCGLYEDCVSHIFCSCPYVVNVWHMSQIHIPSFANRNFLQWTEEWLGGASRFSIDVQGQICGILHAIWSARNTAVWEGSLPTPLLLLRRHAASWTAWTNCEQRRVEACSRYTIQHSTAAPAQSTHAAAAFHCFVDAGFHGTHHAPAYGFVVLDGDSSFVAAANGPLVCQYDPPLAEAMALYEALYWLKDNGYSGGRIYTDSSVLVSGLNDASSFRNYFGFTLLSCNRLINAMPGTLVCFVSRDVNHVAHSLSKHVTAVAGRSLWRDIPPAFILPMVANAI